MQESEMVVTARQWFTKKQADFYFKSRVSVLNYEVLLDHITVPDKAVDIIGFIEDGDSLILFTDAGEIRVRNKLNHPRFKN